MPQVDGGAARSDASGPPVAPLNVARLVTAYYAEAPDPGVASERVVFGTSGHRGSALARSFTQAHVRAVTQSVTVS